VPPAPRMGIGRAGRATICRCGSIAIAQQGAAERQARRAGSCRGNLVAGAHRRHHEEDAAEPDAPLGAALTPLAQLVDQLGQRLADQRPEPVLEAPFKWYSVGKCSFN